MLIMKFKGGLGNQLFQYAVFRSLELSGKNVYADVSSYKYDKKRKFELGYFPNIKLQYISSNKLEKVLESYNNRGILKRILNKFFSNTDLYYYEKENSEYKPELFCIDKKIIDGYFQDINYFQRYSMQIRKELIFPKGENKLYDLVKQIYNDDCSISLHVRRGDYLELEDIYGGICTIEYYEKAIRFIEEKIFPQKAHFYILSDDMEWTKKNIKINNAIYISSDLFSNYQDWYDMNIMSACKYNIIANSSFSWWGAWLNSYKNKIVIRPKMWNRYSEMKGLLLPGWF